MTQNFLFNFFVTFANLNKNMKKKIHFEIRHLRIFCIKTKDHFFLHFNIKTT